jgi:hypothetical protein
MVAGHAGSKPWWIKELINCVVRVNGLDDFNFQLFQAGQPSFIAISQVNE